MWYQSYQSQHMFSLQYFFTFLVFFKPSAKSVKLMWKNGHESVCFSVLILRLLCCIQNLTWLVFLLCYVWVFILFPACVCLIGHVFVAALTKLQIQFFFFWKFRSIFLPSGTHKDCCFNMSHRKWRKPSWNVHLTLIIRPYPISTVGNKTVVHWFLPCRVNGRSLFVWCNLQAKLHSFPCFNTASRLGREANKIHDQIRTTPQSTPVSNHICQNTLRCQTLLY